MLMGGIQRWSPAMSQRPPMQFGPTGAIAPVDPAGYLTPQERTAQAQAAAGGTGVRAVDDTMATFGGGASPTTEGGGGAPAVPLPGGGNPMAQAAAAEGAMAGPAGGAAVAGAAPAAAGGAAAGGGIMGTIMKLLPMLVGA
jgi:collagen type IV alpha